MVTGFGLLNHIIGGLDGDLASKIASILNGNGGASNGKFPYERTWVNDIDSLFPQVHPLAPRTQNY